MSARDCFRLIRTRLAEAPRPGAEQGTFGHCPEWTRGPIAVQILMVRVQRVRANFKSVAVCGPARGAGAAHHDCGFRKSQIRFRISSRPAPLAVRRTRSSVQVNCELTIELEGAASLRREPDRSWIS